MNGNIITRLITKPAFIRRNTKSGIQQVKYIANALTKDTEDVFEMTKNTGHARMKFLTRLSEKCHSDNFAEKSNRKENTRIVLDLFNTIKHPSSVHNQLIEDFNGSLSDISRIFYAAKDNPNKLKFACKVRDTIIKNHQNAYPYLIQELLESPFSREYEKHFDKYIAFLKVHRDLPFVVKKLDKLMSEGTYNPEKYEKILETQKLFGKFPFAGSKVFNFDTFLKDYTEPRQKVFKGLYQNFYIKNLDIKDKEAAEFLKLFESTNEKNYKFRYSIIKNFPELPASSPNSNPNAVYDLSKLFDTVENDKNAKSFVQKLIDYGTEIETPGEINELFANFPPKKLDIFSDNVINIINQTKYLNQHISVLKKEMENPFYESSLFKSTRENSKRFVSFNPLKSLKNSVCNTLDRVTNGINIVRYKFYEKQAAANAEKVEETIRTSLPKPELKTMKKPAVAASEPKVSTGVPLEPKFEVETGIKSENIPITKAETVLKSEAQNLPKAIAVSKKSPAKPSARQLAKEEVRNNVLNFINTKLGQKTLEEQRNAFRFNATKMRLEMLPEMFASVADTRKFDRALGKKHSLSSNKDIVELFIMINGSNKKFINYLLKIRRADNSRVFELNDIIKIVQETEAKVRAEKAANPKYRARDARRYYNQLFEEKVAQYGKVKKTLNKKV